MKKLFALTFLVAAFFPFLSALAGNEWLTNFESAQSTASSQNRNTLVLFTGSDWCPWCVRLEKEIFATPQFEEYAKQNLVLVKIDFPRSTPLPREQQVYNETLARRFGIQGFPTVLIFNPAGKLTLETGYTPGGPKAFIKQISSGSHTVSSAQDAENPQTEESNTTYILIAGLILLLIALGYITWKSIQSSSLELPDPQKYSAEFLGSTEEFSHEKNYLLISGNKFSLTGSFYDSETQTLTLKSGGKIKFIPKANPN